jgi:hypothetical protein
VKTWTRTLIALATAAILASTLEAAPIPGFHVVGQSEHFMFYSREPRKIDSKANESFLMKTAQMMEQAPGTQTAYYLHDYADDIGAVTGVYSSGMTELTTGDIHSTRTFHPHEIVHRIAATLGDPGRFFHEGLAVSLGDKGKQEGVSVDELAKVAIRSVKLRQATDDFARLDPRVAYPMAGSFVGFLIRHHGVATVSSFFRGCQPKVATRDLRFAEVFGQTLDEAGAAWAHELGA